MKDSLVKPKISLLDNLTFDSAMSQMINNDKSLIPNNGIAPTVWKCKWYNKPLNDSNISKFGYSAGDAVWVNTEDLDLFTDANASYVKSVILNNTFLRNKYELVKDNQTELTQLYKDVVTGAVSGQAKGQPLFYIGNITDKVLIRISLSNDNIETPDNNAWWTDFFVNNDEVRFQNIILEAVEKSCAKFLSSHLKDYHLSGIQQYWYENYGTNKSLSDFYALQDMSNVSKYQDFNTTLGTSQVGFDYVVFYHQKKFTDTCWKWFRVWNSGKLEHGGIVKNDSSTASLMGDLLILPNKDNVMTHYKVNLGWSDNVTTAPTYTYGTSTAGFYSDCDSIELGDNYAIPISETSRMLSENNHYDVTLTLVSNDPYSVTNGLSSNVIYYMNNDVDFMTNSSFCFVLQSNVQYYSYHVVGYAKNSEKRFK